jgi:hypothetical protein
MVESVGETWRKRNLFDAQTATGPSSTRLYSNTNLPGPNDWKWW